MLALPQRRQHLPQHRPTSTLPSPPSPQHFTFDQLSQQLSAQQFFDQKLLHDYLESQQQTFASPVVVDNDPNPFMSNPYDFSNPTIRIQQSTPQPQLTSGFSQSSMLSTAASGSGLENWNAYSNVQSLQTPAQSRTGRTHQRAGSSSSIGSSGSQYQAIGSTAGYPYVAHSENSPSRSAVTVDSSTSNTADEPARAFSNVSNHLPTPTHTPTQDSFMNPNNFHSYAPHSASMDQTMAAHLSMKQALLDQHVPDDEVPGFGHSARHSVSSYGHDSPATPHTTQGDEMDFKIPPNDMRQHGVPKLERTYTDVAADYSFDPNSVVAPTQSMAQAKQAANTALLSPYRSSNPSDIIQRSLQAAQIARSHSPSSSRGDSPFRRGSPYRQPSSNYQSPRMRVGTAAAAREQNIEADPAYAMKPHMTSEEAQPKTISPKDALLDYREADADSKMPLFPDSGASEYDHQYNGGDQYRNATQSTFDTTSGQSYRRDSWATPQQFSSNFSTTTAAPAQPSSSFAFVHPSSMSGNMHALPFNSTSQYRSTQNMPATSEQNPEFPAHLTSMESSASEAGPEPGSQSSDRLQKPGDSTADSGTYTCTYHGCSLRFETPRELQKHKREGHRNAASVSSSMTSAALLERNSQAGPHKCERINPTTGKPCNTIFSRPYDLTRHEDTIHNARKQKVRCALCVEEKTFSRNDALTRHMRVVHPEVDFPGKHRRRGGNHD